MNADAAETVFPPSVPFQQPSPAAADEQITDEVFLNRECENAKEAILETLQRMKGDLKVASDVRLWTRKYPWAVVGLATAAGFVAASAVTPSGAPEERQPLPLAEAPCPCRGKTQAVPRQSSWARHMGWIREPMMDLLRTAATTFAATSLQAMKAASQSGSDNREAARPDFS